MKLSLQVFGRRRREEENDINGITWGICTQSGTRKDLILILGGSNLQMRSSEVLVLTGLLAARHMLSIMYFALTWMAVIIVGGTAPPPPRLPLSTVYFVKRNCSNKWKEASGAPPSHCRFQILRNSLRSDGELS